MKISTIILATIISCSLSYGQNISDEENPCNDSRYLKLKEIDLDEMSDREYQYFLKKDESCSNSKNILIVLGPIYTIKKSIHYIMTRMIKES